MNLRTLTRLAIAPLVGIFITAGAQAASAQALMGGGQPQPVQYIVSPETPGPYAPVYIEAQGIGSFLGNSTITWSVDGTSVRSGIGVRTFSFTTGGLGKTTRVDVVINSSDYGTLEHTFVFNPSQLSLVWEANTTVPPFYRGKALMSPGAAVRVVAFPTVLEGGALVAASGLSYQWRLNGSPMPAQSGLGQNVFAFTSDELHLGETVSVDAFYGAATAGHAEITIPAVRPALVLYEHDPLRGVLYNQALGAQFSMPSSELTVRAEPYFFSIESARRGALQYSWQLNGQDITGPNTTQGELTLRQTGAGQGSAGLSVLLQNNDTARILQAAQTTASVLFGAQGGGSFFGL